MEGRGVDRASLHLVLGAICAAVCALLALLVLAASGAVHLAFAPFLVASAIIAGLGWYSSRAARRGAASPSLAWALVGTAGMFALASGILAVLGAGSGATVEAADSPAPEQAPDVGGEVEVLVTSWVGAQNRGDVASYARLYAPAFFGVKRSGDQVVQFNHRDKWIEDRRASLASPTAVVASDADIQTAGDTVYVELTQIYMKEEFADVGRKLLELRDFGDGLRIAHEALYDSTLLGRVHHDLSARESVSFTWIVEEDGAESDVFVRVDDGDGWSVRIPVVPASGVLRSCGPSGDAVRCTVNRRGKTSATVTLELRASAYGFVIAHETREDYKKTTEKVHWSIRVPRAQHVRVAFDTAGTSLPGRTKRERTALRNLKRFARCWAGTEQRATDAPEVYCERRGVRHGPTVTVVDGFDAEYRVQDYIDGTAEPAYRIYDVWWRKRARCAAGARADTWSCTFWRGKRSVTLVASRDELVSCDGSRSLCRSVFRTYFRGR